MALNYYRERTLVNAVSSLTLADGAAYNIEHEVTVSAETGSVSVRSFVYKGAAEERVCMGSVHMDTADDRMDVTLKGFPFAGQHSVLTRIYADIDEILNKE